MKRKELLGRKPEVVEPDIGELLSFWTGVF